MNDTTNTSELILIKEKLLLDLKEVDNKIIESEKIQIGRPTKVKGAKLDKKISCYFTSEEMALIDQARGGTAKATFVRDLVLKEIA